jgi:hypothetical protein
MDHHLVCMSLKQSKGKAAVEIEPVLDKAHPAT